MSASLALVGLPALLAPVAAAPAETLPMGYGSALLRMLAALVVVCVLAYLALRFGLRRLGAVTSRQQHLRVIERCALGPGKALWIVSVGKRTLLVGSAEQGLSLLAELDEGEIELDQPESDTVRPRGSFSEVFARVLGRSRETKASPPPETDSEQPAERESEK